MFELSLQKLKTKKIQVAGFFLFFIFINTTVDYLNLTYSQMLNKYGLTLVITNISLNVIMSFLTAIMLTLSMISLELKGSETKSQNLSFFSVIFSIMTYGCTSCVINFLAAVGISYSVVALPFAGLPYKFMALGLLILGLLFTRYEINKPCKIK